MQPHDIFVLTLCILVFTLLVALFGVLIYLILKANLKLIRYGANDQDIKEEYVRLNTKRRRTNKKLNKVFTIIASIIVWIIIFVMVGVTVYMGVTADNVVGDIPVLKTVKSSSMAKVAPENWYIDEAKLEGGYEYLDAQFQTTDLLLLEKLPAEEDLKLYDIVLYESPEGELILHRIVYITTAEETEDGIPLYLMQGDAVLLPDNLDVTYSQMKGIYRGNKIPILGNVIQFFQSIAGNICIAVIILVSIAWPIYTNLTNKIKTNRLKEIGFIDDQGEIITSVDEEKDEIKEEEET